MCWKQNPVFYVLIGLAAVRGLIYIAIFPPWLAPDEPAHYEAIRLLGQEHQWPTDDVYATTTMHPQMHASFLDFRIWQISHFEPPPFTADNDGHPIVNFVDYYAPTSLGSVVVAGNYPLIYHSLLAILAGPLDQLNIVTQLYILRLPSIIILLFTILAAWHFAATIFPTEPQFPIAVTSFLIFLPMFLHVSTTLNTDGLTTCLVSLYFLVLAKTFIQGVSNLKLMSIVGLLTIAILTKPTALFLVPTSFAAIVILLARRLQWRWYIPFIFLLTIGLVTLPASVLIFQFAEGGRGIATLSFSANKVGSEANYLASQALMVYISAVRWAFLSFWGAFGWAKILVPFSWIRILWLITFAISVGVGLFFLKHIVDWKGNNQLLNYRQKDLLTVLFASIIFSLIGVFAPTIATQSTKWGPPARYFFPALLPFSLYFFLGFKQLVPKQFSSLTLPIWLTALITFDSAVIILVLLPVLYA